MIRWLVLAWALALTSCQTLSGNPAADITTTAAKTDLGKVVVQGLLDATYDLDQAVAVGALPKSDPAPGCFHAVLTQLGLDPANPAPAGSSFTPKISDLISLGSVLYVRAQQLKGAQGGGIQVPADCKLLVAQFMLDAAAYGAKGLPGGGLAIPFK